MIRTTLRLAMLRTVIVATAFAGSAVFLSKPAVAAEDAGCTGTRGQLCESVQTCGGIGVVVCWTYYYYRLP